MDEQERLARDLAETLIDTQETYVTKQQLATMNKYDVYDWLEAWKPRAKEEDLPMEMLQWYDAEDTLPYVVCLAELGSGERVEACFAAGSWETLNGEGINPIRWTPLRIVALRGLYSINDLL